MTIGDFVTILAGVLALIGLIGIFGGAWAKRLPQRHRIFRAGSVAMGSAGLVLLVAGLLGHAETGQMLGGLMLLIFGTAISLPGAQQPNVPAARVSRT